MRSKNYIISFNHSTHDDEGNRRTLAFVRDRATGDILVVGQASCKPPDQFSKEVGRIKALRNAWRHNKDAVNWREVFNTYNQRPQGPSIKEMRRIMSLMQEAGIDPHGITDIVRTDLP